jgi:hypothetical protein
LELSNPLQRIRFQPKLLFQRTLSCKKWSFCFIALGNLRAQKRTGRHDVLDDRRLSLKERSVMSAVDANSRVQSCCGYLETSTVDLFLLPNTESI